METIAYNQEDRIGILTIQRPQALNALNGQVLKDLQAVLDRLDREPVSALIVTGAGEKSFIAGADIKEMESMTAHQAREFAHRGQHLFRRLEEAPYATIAAVNGFALGGGFELALACDWIVASQNAKWGLPEVSLGLIPGYGGTQRLARVAGRALAKRVALTAEVFTADQGLAWGIFSQVVEPGQVMDAARKQAQMILTRAPLAVAAAKRAIDRGFDERLDDGLKIEADAFGKVFESQDHTEGIQAFIQKRTPRFKGE